MPVSTTNSHQLLPLPTEYFIRRVILMIVSFILCFFSAISLQSFLENRNIHSVVGNTLFFDGYDVSSYYFLILSFFFFCLALCFFYPPSRFAPIWEKVKTTRNAANLDTLSYPLPPSSWGRVRGGGQYLLLDTWNLGEWTFNKKIICWVFFTFLFLALTYPALNYEFVWDDLHLIRPYSWPELASVWSGNWDVDGVENPGYRPLMTWWYALLYSFFGEQVIGYRILSASLIALSYVLIIELGRHFVHRWELILIGLVLAAFSHTQSLYIGFITEAFRPLQLFLAVSSLLALYIGLTQRSPQPPLRRGTFAPLLKGGWGDLISLVIKNKQFSRIAWILLSLILYITGLFTREENSLIFIPICTLILFFIPKRHKSRVVLILLYFIPILVYWQLRYSFVPATTFYYEFLVWGPIVTFHTALSSYPLWGMPLYIFAAALCLSKEPLSRFFLFCIGMSILSCAPSFSGLIRPDTAFFVTIWLGLAAAFGVEALLSLHLKARALCGFLILLTVVNGMHGNWLRMYSMHPLATHVIEGNAAFLYGSYGAKATRSYGYGPSNTVTIPKERFAYLRDKYHKLGYKAGAYKDWLNALEKKAEQEKRFYPDQKEIPFKSKMSFFYYR